MLEQRKALVRDLAEKHGIAGYDHDLSDAEIKAFEEKLDEAVVAQQKKIEKIKVRSHPLRLLPLLVLFHRSLLPPRLAGSPSSAQADVGALLCPQSEARAAENKYQDEIQALKSAKAADERAKANIADQIVRRLSPLFPLSLSPSCERSLTHRTRPQRSANSRIANISRQLDATTTSVADITYLESQLAEEKERQATLNDKQRADKYAEQLQARAREAKEVEEKRDSLHTELAGLNAQANTRAKLQLRRTEKTRKDEAVASLIERSAASYRKFLKADPTRDKMEAEVTELIKCVAVPVSSTRSLGR